MTALVIADMDRDALSDSTRKTLSAAALIGEPVDILVAGLNVAPAAKTAAFLEGVNKVLVADAPPFEHGLAEPLADLIVSLAANYSTIAASATSRGKSILPRVAALLDVMQVSEVVKVLSPTTFERPIYAGNAIQTVESTDHIRVLTVRTAAFPAVGDGNGAAPIESLQTSVGPGPTKFLGAQISENSRPELTAAKVVISGGRALQSAENFEKLIAPVADRLGAAIGASRAAVDSGFAPNDWQVGQTGKVVAPELYIAVGVSGAIQHLAGMKDSKVIVAINKDEEAPIFQVADYGLVQDLFAALPELKDELDKAKS